MAYRGVPWELPRNFPRGPTGVPVVRPRGSRGPPRHVLRDDNLRKIRRFPGVKVSKLLSCSGNYRGNSRGKHTGREFPRFPVGYRGIPRDAVRSRGYSRYTTGKKKHPAGHRGFPRDVPLFTVGCTTDPHGAPWYTVGSH